MQTVQKLFELYSRLRELGNPVYLNSNIPPIPCSMGKEEADSMVEKTQQVVTEWMDKVTELRTCYPWLLYFSIPRILQLHDLIQLNLSISLDKNEITQKKIIHEVSFLAASNPVEREKLMKGIQVCVDIIMTSQSDKFLFCSKLWLKSHSLNKM